MRRASDPDAGRAVRSDGGANVGGGATAVNFERLAAFDRFRSVRASLSNPLRTLRSTPVAVLYLRVPLAVLSVLVRVGPDVTAGTATVESVDDAVVQAGLFVMATFAVVQELKRQRLAAIERATPDMLDRLASVNEAGMTVVERFRRVADGDLGVLDDEIRRMWRDIEWGTDAATALHRFEDRIDSPTITRVVTLVTNAMHASGDIGRVLRIAADDAQATRRLKRARRQEMLTYVVIIYLSFLVFLVIVGSLNSILIPALEDIPAADAGSGPVGVAGIGDISGVDIDAYTLVFFHTALVQGLFSGLVAGKMGEESAKNGVKHATAMVAIAYVVFLALP